MRGETAWVLGGDLRQSWLARLLAREGVEVHTYGVETPAETEVTEETGLTGIGEADCVILPLPVSGEAGRLNAPAAGGPVALEGVFARLPPGQVIFGGRVDPDAAALAARYGLTIRDYWEREELAAANAVPTAEGAVQLAMENLPITVHRARVLILGFGRVGRVTAQRFSALGAEVTVAARRCEARTWAQVMGCRGVGLEDLKERLGPFDLVVNTIPAQVLGEEELAGMRPDCLVLDLASRPGGVDRAAAERLGRRVIWALSLPGKAAPATAGAAIQNTIVNMLHELGA